MAVHREACYRGARTAGPLVQSDAAEAESLILPIYAELGEDDQAYVIDQLEEALAEVLAKGPSGSPSAGATR
jgi:dTDP-4-amino-4,6-dideoxygalactose transaminase